MPTSPWVWQQRLAWPSARRDDLKISPDDADGLVDCADGECKAAPNCVKEICDNGLDDDSDGLRDFPADPRRSVLINETAARRFGWDDPVGKTIREARDEVRTYSNPHFIEAAEGLKRFRGVINPSTQEDSLDKRLLITHEPIGVVAVISPWNWPADIPNIAVSHGLAAGNSVILKPASTTPFSAIAIAEIYQEAGFPAGSVSVLTGPGPTVGAELVRNPGTNAISFTGETKTGEAITQIAGNRSIRNWRLHVETFPLAVSATTNPWSFLQSATAGSP